MGSRKRAKAVTTMDHGDGDDDDDDDGGGDDGDNDDDDDCCFFSFYNSENIHPMQSIL